jgi:membrane protease YdiL (CAAX protease family)
MTTITAFIKQHPVVAYFALVFAISWGGILIVVGSGGYPGTAEQVERLSLFVMLALFAGPSITGILLTSLVSGWAGLRELRSRLLRWRVGARWYAVALLFAPLLVTAVLLALSLRAPAFLPHLLTTSDKVYWLLFGISYGLIGGGFLEELGWTGFAVPRLRLRYGVLTTGVIVGLLWAAWHVLVTFWMSGDVTGALSLDIFLPAIVFYAGSLPAYRVLLVWVYDHTGSLPVVMLMHAFFSASRIILDPKALALAPGLIYNLILAAALWIIVAVVAVASHGQLTRQPLRPQVA